MLGSVCAYLWLYIIVIQGISEIAVDTVCLNIYSCFMPQGNRRETRLLGILSFVHSTVWKVLFGKVNSFT